MENERPFGVAQNTAAQSAPSVGASPAQGVAVGGVPPQGSVMPLRAAPFTSPAATGRSLWRFVVLGGGALLLLVVAVVVFIAQAGRQQQVQNSQYGLVKIPLSSLSSKGTSLGNADSLKVNGRLQVTSSLELAPAAQPANPQAGQIYYDQSANQLGYYNGQSFTYLTGGGSSTTNNTFVTNGGTTTTVNVTNIQAGGGGVGVVNGAAGSLALFSDASTLTASLLTQSGGTLVTGGGLQVHNTGNVNLLSIDTTGNGANLGVTGTSATAGTVHVADSTGAAQTVTVGSLAGSSSTTLQGGLGGVSINTGGTAGSSGSITIMSGASTGTAAGDVTVDTGNGFVSGTVISNFTFETGNEGITGWTPNSTVTTTSQNCTISHSGSCSLSFSGPAFWGILGNTTPGQEIPVVAGHHYFISAWVRAATTSTQMTGAIMWNVGTFNSQVLSFSTTSTSAAGWTQMTATGIAPAGATEGVFRFGGIGGSTSNGTQYLDDVTVTDLSSGSSSSELHLGDTNAQIVTIGNMNEVGPTTIYGGSGITLNSGSANIGVNGGAINVTGSGASSFTTSSGSLTLSGGGSTSGGVVVKTQTGSSTAFQVQDAGGTQSLLNVDNSTGTVTAGLSTGSSIGSSTIGDHSGAGSGVDRITAQKITTTGAGTVTSMSGYIGLAGVKPSPHNVFQFAIYDDNSGQPGSYIASSAIGTMTAAGAWYTLPITASLSASTTYWLVYWQHSDANDSTNDLTYFTGIGGAATASNTFSWQTGTNNGMPTSFPTSGMVTNSGVQMSLYATFATNTPALTISQFGGLTQSGSALFQDPTDSSNAFQVQNSLGTSLLAADTASMAVNVGGAVTVKPTSSNATTAFQVQNSSGNTAFAVNSTNGIVTVNTASSCSYSSYTGYVASLTPASYWKLEDTGSTAADSSGNNNTGTLSNVTTNQTPGPFSCDTTHPGMSFNGTNSKITAANSAVAPSNYSEVVMFKTSAEGALIGYSDSGGGNSDRHLYVGSDGKLYSRIWNTGLGVFQTINSPGTVNDGNWHIAVATLSSTLGMKLYLDGSLVASNATYTTPQSYTGGWVMGSFSFLTPFNGKIAQAAVFGSALTPLQVQALSTYSGFYTASLASIGVGTTTPSANLDIQGTGLFKNGVDSATAFQIQNSAGTALLTADTSGMTVMVTNLVVTATLTVNGHIVTGGSTPAIAAGAAACTSPTVSIAGNDTSGTITINTGTGCSGGGTLATITFASAFGAAPHVVLTPGSPISQTLGAYVDDATLSTTAFDLGTNATPLSSQTFKWNYWTAQ